MTKLKIAIVHNDYGKFSGEEAVVESHVKLFTKRGHCVVQFRRSSAELGGALGNLKGLCAGIYNPFSKKRFAAFLKREKPDLVHIHNLYPLINPCILPEAKKQGIPVVMTVHNFRLVCPNGLFYSNGQICEKCPDASYWECVKNNCLGGRIKSLGYALRSYIGDKFKYYKNNVDIFLCLSEFQKNKLIQYGVPKDKCAVLPNFITDDWLKSTSKHRVPPFPNPEPRTSNSDYIAYAGRLSNEKGIDLIIGAAKQLPEIKFKLAGVGTDNYENIPGNVEFLGHLTEEKLINFYKNARIQIMTSRCYEGFPSSLLYGMAMGLPSVVPNHGAMPEIIKGVGFTFKPDSLSDLCKTVENLLHDNEACSTLGRAAQKKCRELYSEAKYYGEISKIYRQVIV